jgi:hypothetical protein
MKTVVIWVVMHCIAVYFEESQAELSLPHTSAGFLLGLLLCPEGGSEVSDSA